MSEGLITSLVERATNPSEGIVVEEVRLQLSDAIKATFNATTPDSSAGCTEAICALRKQLEFGNAVVNKNALLLFDFLFLHCGNEFVVALTSKETLGCLHHFITKHAAGQIKQRENRQLCLNLIAQWAIQIEHRKRTLSACNEKHLGSPTKLNPPLPPNETKAVELRELFETLVRENCKFPQSIWDQ
ncbi:hypothetical protein BDR26DRAFT_849271, partial [Obelidium mucronatum]